MICGLFGGLCGSLVDWFVSCVWLLAVGLSFGCCVGVCFCGLFAVFLWFRCWVLVEFWVADC